MGGHGGLNILPQKRWNVYRRDNRAKVAWDEAEQRERQASEERKQRVAELDRKIGKLRAHAGYITADNDGTTSLKTDEAELSRKHSIDAVVPVEKKVTHHVNLFADEEKAFRAVEEKHLKYLTEVGHDRTTISDFDRIQHLEVPWYMRPTGSVAPRTQEVTKSCFPPSPPASPHHHHKRRKTAKEPRKTIEQLREERLQRERDDRKRREQRT